MLPTVLWTLVLLGGGVVFAVVSARGGVRTGACILDGRLAWGETDTEEYERLHRDLHSS